MKWSETVASKCRYGDVAENLFGTHEILWEDSEDGYQGNASVLTKHGDTYCFYEWDYGSCSSCDGWESDNLSDRQVQDEMEKSTRRFNSKNELKEWLDELSGPVPSNYSMERGGGLAAGLDILSGGLRDRINAIRKELEMSPIEVKSND